MSALRTLAFGGDVSGHDIISVAGRLGARLKRSGPNERVGPCPRCGGRDRFSINMRKQVWNCRGCGFGGDVIAFVRHVIGCSYPEALQFIGEERRPWMTRPEPNPEPPKPSADDSAYALSVWDAGVDPRGTPAQRYLAFRGLELGDDIAVEVLRWHLGIGAMLALFRSIETDEPRAISRTFLNAEGRKIERRFLGPVAGAAVKLDADDEVLSGLHTGEGVETCLAARQLGLRPTWALGSKGAIGAFPVLSGVECLTILGEPNAEKEIDACATRWHAAGREVFINTSLFGSDLNDALIARGQAQP
jgi:CHC2 zinc finger